MKTDAFEVSEHVDWLSFTVLDPLPDIPKWLGEHRQEPRGGMGYNQQLLFSTGARLFMSTENRHQHIQLSANALWHVGHRNALDWAVGLCDDNRGRITRIDLAHTVYSPSGAPYTPLQLSECVKSGEAVTRSKRHHFTVDELGGETLSIGGRTSRKFVRIYDKGIEALKKEDLILATDVPGQRIRTELEYKDKDTGVDVARDLLTGERSIAATIRSVIDFPGVEGWVKAMNQEADPLPQKPRPDTNTGKWLRAAVVPAAARHFGQPGREQEFQDWLQHLITEVAISRADWRDENSHAF